MRRGKIQAMIEAAEISKVTKFLMVVFKRESGHWSYVNWVHWQATNMMFEFPTFELVGQEGLEEKERQDKLKLMLAREEVRERYAQEGKIYEPPKEVPLPPPAQVVRRTPPSEKPKLLTMEELVKLAEEQKPKDIP